jgi:hypothetical protein
LAVSEPLPPQLAATDRRTRHQANRMSVIRSRLV